MKKFFALLVSVVLLLGLLASFPAAGLDEGGQPILTENSLDYEGSLDENNYENVLKLNKVVVDKDGKPYNGEPDKEFTIRLTGPGEYSETVRIKANSKIALEGLKPGTYTIQEDVTENYTRIDENTTVTLGDSKRDIYFPDHVTAWLGNNWVGDPVLPGRSNPETALVDEPSDTDIPYQDGNFLSLGYGGVAVFEYDKPFYNGPDVEVGVSEITWFFDEYGESGYVEISQDGTEDSWKYLGQIYGDRNQEGNNGKFFMFDMENTGLDWARFIRITDESGQLDAYAAPDTTPDTSVTETSPETIENTTGPGVEYGDPMDGVDINYVCTRYMDNFKSVDIVNRHNTTENPPVVNPPAASTTSTSGTQSPVEYFKLTTAVSGEGSILPGPGVSSYARGMTVQLKPEPATGWEFDCWQGDAVDGMNRILIDKDKSVTAVFREISATQPKQEEPAPVGNEINTPEDETSPAAVTIDDEEIPKALPRTLPKTGGIPAFIFIGAGGALILTGIAATIRRK